MISLYCSIEQIDTWATRNYFTIAKVRPKSGSKMNMKKPEVMFNNYLLYYEIRLYEEVIECVQKYIYLGHKIGACQRHKKMKKIYKWNGVVLVGNTML